MSTERDVEEGFGWVCRTGTCFRGWAEGGKMLRLSGLDYAGWLTAWVMESFGFRFGRGLGAQRKLYNEDDDGADRDR